MLTLRPGEKVMAGRGRPRDLYPRPEDLQGDLIVLAEGERDAVNFNLGGLPACAIPGAGAAHLARPERFAGRRVIVCLDCDERGRNAAERISKTFALTGIEHVVVDLDPGRNDGFDFSDLVAEIGPEAAAARVRALAGGGKWQGGNPSTEVPHATPAGGVGTPDDATEESKPNQGFSSLFSVLDLAVAPPPPEVIVHDFAYRREITGLIGPGGIGKSVIAWSVGAAARLHQEVGGMATEPIERVLIIDCEQGAHTARRRARQLGLHKVDGVTVVDAMSTGFDLMFHEAELLALVDQIEPDLIVVDTLRSAARSADENDSAQMTYALTVLRRAAERGRGAGVIVLLHTGKDLTRGARGSTAIRDQASLTFELSRPSRDSKALRLRCSKARIIAEPDDRHLKIEQDGVRLRVVAADTTNVDSIRRPARDSLRDRIVDALEVTPMRRPELARTLELDPKDRTLRRAVNDLLDDDAISRDDDDLLRVTTDRKDPA
jgi:hypothetical protein